MPLDRQPTLVGDIVLLRPLQREDWEALYSVVRDPAIWAGHPVKDRWREEVFREFFEDALAKSGALVVVDRASGQTVGSSRFERYAPGDGGGSIEIGWTFLARACWGTGHNRDMKRLMVGHALASVARVDFRVGETNLRSRRALEKIGARLAPGRFEEAQVPGIGKVRHLYYEMTHEDFASGPLAF